MNVVELNIQFYSDALVNLRLQSLDGSRFLLREMQPLYSSSFHEIIVDTSKKITFRRVDYIKKIHLFVLKRPNQKLRWSVCFLVDYFTNYNHQINFERSYFSLDIPIKIFKRDRII